MKLALAVHESSLRHDTGYGHPERPARIGAVLEGVKSTGLPIERVAPPRADRSMLIAVHDPEYIDQIERFCRAGGGHLDMDTAVGPESWEAALRAAAAGPAVCEILRAGDGDLGFVLMRPPGHHARRDQAMGFCVFNNIAITAADLIGRGERVAIVDWDVHHGNGTQEQFYSNPDVMYLSLHQAGIYPGTGHLTEVGEGPGEGTNLNIAVPRDTGGAFYRRAVGELLTPMISAFAPDWILVSAGYDAHRADPLASLSLDADDYGAMATILAPLVPAGRAVVFLEGGYNLEALRESAAATVRGWIDPSYAPAAAAHGIDPEAYLISAARVAARYWNLS